MDVTKLKTAINDLQNASTKVKPFLDLLKKADDVWVALQDFDPAQVQSLAQQKTDNEATVAKLQGQIKDLQAQVASVDEKAKAREAQLNAEMNDRAKTKQASIDAEHAQRIATAQTTIAQYEQHIASLAKQVDTLTNQKSSLEQSVGQLQDRMRQVSAALHV